MTRLLTSSAVFAVLCLQRAHGSSGDLDLGSNALGDLETTFAICRCHGDPHCTLFDGTPITYSLTCTYLMVQDGCTGGLPDGPGDVFRVLIDPWDGDTGRPVSFVRAAVVDLWDLQTPVTVTLEKRLVVKLDGVIVNHFPVLLEGKVKINNNGRQIVITIPYGNGKVVIVWNGNNMIKVTVPSDLKGQTCGLCGVYNDDPGDDRIMGDGNGICDDPNVVPGQMTLEDETYVSSWLFALDDDARCDESCEQKAPLPVCTEQDYRAARAFCDVLTDPNGRFADCLSVACGDEELQRLRDDCIFDRCLVGAADREDGAAPCEEAKVLADRCRDVHGVDVTDWRGDGEEDQFCAIQCGDNMHYEECGSSCGPSCLDPDGADPEDCQDECVEGCFCDKGYVQDGDLCLTPDQCGCVKDGTIYGVGESMVSPDCTESCVCESQGAEMNCTPNVCDINSECVVIDGVRQCACKEGFVWDETSCTEVTITVHSDSNDPCPGELLSLTCAPSCPLTCEDPDGSGCQDDSGCVDGCFCPDGLVINSDGETCVDPGDCTNTGGCVHDDGKTYQVGESLMNANCSELCVCPADGEAMQCSDSACDPDYGSCVMDEDGSYGCQCDEGHSGDGQTCEPSTATCRCHGDPHCNTYDGMKFVFFGTCTYLYSADGCGADGAPRTYAVHIDTWNRDREDIGRLSWVKQVNIEFYTEPSTPPTVVSLFQDKEIEVNGVTVSHTPATLGADSNVVIIRNNRFVIVYFPNGAVLYWNGRNMVKMTAPTALSGQLCGLCGNNNGDVDDDLTTGGGNEELCEGDSTIEANLLAESSDYFARSWLTALDDDLHCLLDCEEITVPECSDEDYQEALDHCNVLTSERFAACLDVIGDHSVVQELIDACAEDTCLAGDPNNENVCLGAEELVAMCISLDPDTPLGDWRDEDFCPWPCPADMMYQTCGPVCGPSCLDPSGDLCQGLPDDCVEGCFCDEGLYQDGDTCISPDTCGCVYNGQYYDVGETVVAEDCSETCVCSTDDDGQAEMVCSPTPCDANAHCVQIDGLVQCVCNTGYDGDGWDCTKNQYATCRLHGDPHINTYDGWLYVSMETCWYVFTQDGCTDGVADEDAWTFKVLVDQWNKNNNKKWAWLKQAVVYIRETLSDGSTVVRKIELQKGGIISVDGVQVQHLPAQITSDVKVKQAGKKRFIVFSSGIIIQYDGNDMIKVTVPVAMQGQMCGVCGNYNDDPSDDWIMGDSNGICDDANIQPGVVTTNQMLFTKSWLVKIDDDQFCLEECVVIESPPNCPKGREERAKKQCSILVQTHGPFGNCLSKMNLKERDGLFNDCMYDTCLDEDAHYVCEQAEELSKMCQDQYNLEQPPWRTKDFCPLECGSNMHYDSCGSSCQPSCLDVKGADCVDVEDNCEEGCFCDDGFVEADDGCVPVEECGCEMDGWLYEIGESVMTEDCEELCTCTEASQDGGNPTMNCAKSNCDPDSVCEVKNGQRDCVCKQGYEGDGFSCTCVTCE